MEITALHGFEMIGSKIVVKVDFIACFHIPRRLERERFWEGLRMILSEHCSGYLRGDKAPCPILAL